MVSPSVWMTSIYADRASPRHPMRGASGERDVLYGTQPLELLAGRLAAVGADGGQWSWCRGGMIAVTKSGSSGLVTVTGLTSPGEVARQMVSVGKACRAAWRKLGLSLVDQSASVVLPSRV